MHRILTEGGLKFDALFTILTNKKKDTTSLLTCNKINRLSGQNLINWVVEVLSNDSLYLQGKLKLQQLCVAGSSVTEEFGILGVSLDCFAVMFHG